MATQNELKIDSSHCRAICDEIGDRLRAMLERYGPVIERERSRLRTEAGEDDGGRG